MDIIRNVGIREPVGSQGSSKITDTDINSLAMKLAESKLNRNSLPNILLKEAAISTRTQRITNGNSTNNASKHRSANKANKANKANAVHVEANTVPHDGDDDGAAAVAAAAADDDDAEVECAVSGRLEIRVIQQSQEPAKNSPNRDESVYFDAVANGQQNAVDDAGKVSRKVANKMYAGHAIDHNNEASALATATIALTPSTTMLTADCGNFEPVTDETAFYSVQTTGRMHDDAQIRFNLSNNSNPNSDGVGDNNRVVGNNGTGFVATSLGITDNNSSMNDDNVADSLILTGHALAKSSNVIGKLNVSFVTTNDQRYFRKFQLVHLICSHLLAE